MEITNRVAVVTGAASGIGREVTLQLAQRGAKAVAMVDMTETVTEAAAEVNDKAGRQVAFPFQGNVTDEAFRTSVFDQMDEQFGLTSICIPAAGITRDDLALRLDKSTGKLRVYPVETFRLVVEVNLIAPVYWALEMIARIGAGPRLPRGSSAGYRANICRARSSSSAPFRRKATRARSRMPAPRPASKARPQP